MHRYTPLAAAVLAALSTYSYADDGSPTQSAPIKDVATLPTVKVTGEQDASQNDYQPAVSNVGAKTPQALRDIPQTVNVVDKELMQAQGASSLADALRNVPGITIGGAEGGQIGNNINLRGFTARTDIYIDGFRDRGQYYRDLFDLEQVEVLQGPSSMLFGRGSTGGVINQETKQAKLSNFAEVSGTVGSDGRVRTTFDDNTKLSDDSAVRVNVFAQDLQTTRDVMQNKDFGVAPTLRL
ncbi:MAG TPA: TonB-dependent receptor plug domain-containing protein, partial [Burkholderiaceae bacterium]|nr:TonB-dependent receptor plug domain-containing protein [Burkholderiaceae bacterium]